MMKVITKFLGLKDAHNVFWLVTLHENITL